MNNKYYSFLNEEEKQKYKTERQWMICGYVPVSADVGIMMYPNRFCQPGKLRYLKQEEVRPMTSDERSAFSRKRNVKRRVRRKG